MRDKCIPFLYFIPQKLPIKKIMKRRDTTAKAPKMRPKTGFLLKNELKMLFFEHYFPFYYEYKHLFRGRKNTLDEES